MASVTFAIPDSVKSDMKRLSWVNWSELVVGESIKRQMLHEGFEEFNRIVSKSKLTEEDAMMLAKEVNAGMYRKLKKLHPELR